jgi:hypothetical protein
MPLSMQDALPEREFQISAKKKDGQYRPSTSMEKEGRFL